jgi:phytoene dehydrogenase-like protein
VTRRGEYDAVVIGSGPNGLAAAITLARAGKSVVVFEAADEIGGGTRSAELTLQGFVHDVCSAVHPMGAASPFFRELPVAQHGLDWIHPPLCVAHPLDGGRAAILDRDIEKTCAALGADGLTWRRLVGSLAKNWPKLEDVTTGPIGLPKHPFAAAAFGVHAIQSAISIARGRFATEEARALIAGLAAHSLEPLDSLGTGAVALVFAVVGHVYGWPIPRGGSQKIADALASYLIELGGEIVMGVRVRSLSELPTTRATLCDTSVPGLMEIAGSEMPASYRAALEKFNLGMGVFKVNWALSAPIPWAAAECRAAGTVHVGGTLEEIAVCENDVNLGKVPERPFVLMAQSSLFDSTRAPAGKHTGWGYCHVPAGCDVDMTERIEAQIERFAPGFRDVILARSTRGPAELERENPNLIGGNVTGGANTLRQILLRPTVRQYSTPVRGLYLCSASTPPGGGVHGMCGYHAASRALKFLGGR